MGNSLRITPLTMYQIDNTCYSGLLENLPKRPTNNRGYQDLLLVGFDIDTDVFLNNMLAELAEMQLIYTNPDFFKFAVTNWALKEKDIWQRLYDTVFYKYNPIWNKDGTIRDTGLETRNLANSSTESGENSVSKTIENENESSTTEQNRNTVNLSEGYEGERTINEEGTDNEERNLTGSDNGTIDMDYGHSNIKTNTGTVGNSGTDNTTNSVSAYNDTGFVNRDKSENTMGNTRTDNLNETDNGTNFEQGTNNHATTDAGTIDRTTAKDTTDNNTYTKTNTGTNNTDNNIHVIATNNGTETTSGTDEKTVSGTETGTIGNNLTRIEQGNIGVTTTQQMIEAERELVKFNVYDLIIDSFKQRFCLLCY